MHLLSYIKNKERITFKVNKQTYKTLKYKYNAKSANNV